ncbi:MAG: capsule assembly Wzi family protein [Acidobacteria bacterium]|nr:capsule assembly Wzi family protein [Acidobacteriota bacterium]
MQAGLAQTQTTTTPAQPAIPAATQVPDFYTPSVPAATPSNTTPQRTAVPAATPVPDSSRPAVPGYAPETETERQENLGSTYIPVDSYIYPMALRLYSMGYLNTAFINMRPWTRRSLLHMLQESSPAIIASNNTEAVDILAKLDAYLSSEGGETATASTYFDRGLVYGAQAVYTRAMGITGQTLRDSFHLGQTIAEDYGRPYEQGFNNITGFATVNEYGRFSLYLRGEYQHSPSSFGYSTVGTGNPLAPNGLAETLSEIDEINYQGPNQSTIPAGPIAAQNPFRLMEANLSFYLLGNEISGGKSDAWEGPGLGSAMAWSNNAENIYSFRINRVEPLHVPLLSDLLGPLRYDFFVGSLKGHAYPNEPWVHSEMFSFAPTSNFQFGFERSVIWGGHGHGCLQPNGVVTPCDEPITIGTFLRSFFSISDTTGPEKYSVKDPGARFSAFNFSWRLPFVSHHITLYTDSISHDDVSPVSAPRRAGYRPGIYLSQVPRIPKLDFRVEGVSTDCSTTICENGSGEYWEVVQRQGYTNKGFIMGDWIGREAMGGQAWLTYHLSADQWIQMEYMKKRTPADFIPGGTSQNQYKFDVLKRLGRDVQLDAWIQVERWKAPIYIDNPNNDANFDTTMAFQLTWFPKLRTENDLFGHQ